MSESNVFEFQGRDAHADPLTELLSVGAQRLIRQAVEAELQELLVEHSERRTEGGKAGVVRNGYLPARELQTGVGPVTVRIPKVRAKTGEAVSFRSALVPPYVRKTKSLEAAQVPVLLAQVDDPLASAMADGAYDTLSVYAALEAHGSGPPPQILISPRHDAQTNGTANASSQRDATIRAIDAVGRRRWAHESGYTRRSLVETAMSRYKTIIGGSMRSRTMLSQKVEAALGCAILNRMTHLGMPDGDCIA